MDNSEQLGVSLCSGYGGIERGLEIAGVKTRIVTYVEIEAYAIANLVAKMEQGLLVPAPVWTNLKTFKVEKFRGLIDFIVGGYPCQPFSCSGKRKGHQDERHLWPYIRQIYQGIRPSWMLFENVEGHVSLGLSTVISDLEEDGYKSTFGIFTASEVGASHIRKRLFILAYDYSKGLPRRWGHESGTEETKSIGFFDGKTFPNFKGRVSHDWEVARLKPKLGRTDDGFAHKLDRLRLLGNGVVPQQVAKAYLNLKRELCHENCCSR